MVSFCEHAVVTNSLFGFRNGSLSTVDRYRSLPHNLLNCDSDLDLPRELAEDICQRIRWTVSSVSGRTRKAPALSGSVTTVFTAAADWGAVLKCP